MKTVGSRAQVWNGNAKKTSGGLTKKDLIKKKGRIRSKRASKSAKKNQNLKNAGWTFKKGEFGAVRIEDKSKSKSKKKGSKRMKGGSKGGQYFLNENGKASLRALLEGDNYYDVLDGLNKERSDVREALLYHVNRSHPKVLSGEWRKFPAAKAAR